MPSEVTTWAQWKKKHPETTVLKPPFDREIYAHTNRWYEKYRKTDQMMFPEGNAPISKKYKRKDDVTIILRDGKARCYPHQELMEGEQKDGDLTIVKEGLSVRVLDKDGKEVPSMLAYWYAFCAFYLDGSVYRNGGR